MLANADSWHFQAGKFANHGKSWNVSAAICRRRRPLWHLSLRASDSSGFRTVRKFAEK
jgi:hypothetical protein